jgi:hypothetical protein
MVNLDHGFLEFMRFGLKLKIPNIRVCRALPFRYLI